MKSAIAIAAVAAGLTVGTSPAYAGFVLGLDVGGDIAVGDIEDGIDTAGFAFAGRAGYMFGNDIVRVTPELKLGFESPGSPNAFRILGGARLHLFKGLSPVVFAHLGGLAGDIQGFGWDVGAGLDLTFIKILDIGAYFSYNRAEDAELNIDNLTDSSATWEWMQIGAQVTLKF